MIDKTAVFIHRTALRPYISNGLHSNKMKRNYMDINKLCEERVLLAGEAEKEKETLACINKEIKKRKDYIRSLHLLEENRYDNAQARKQYAGLLHLL